MPGQAWAKRLVDPQAMTTMGSKYPCVPGSKRKIQFATRLFICKSHIFYKLIYHGDKYFEP
jgi:hypothetical protein